MGEHDPGYEAAPAAPVAAVEPHGLQVHETGLPEKAGKPDRAAAVKAWGDAVTALLKALILVLAIGVAATIIAVFIWRDQHSRVVAVNVSPEVDKLLASLGVDIDPRQALVEVLNERLRGVQQIVALQGFSFTGDQAQTDAVSFKPFGLELSVGDVTRLVRLVFDRPPQPSVRLEILCPPPGCTGAMGGGQATLVVHMFGREGPREASFPIALGHAGVHRALLQAIKQIADLVLEENEPVIASVLFLNRAVSTDTLSDQFRTDVIRAEGAAIAGREAGDGGCLSDIMTGLSMWWRGQFADFIAAERRAAQARNLTCKIHSDTNIAYLLPLTALCNESPAERQVAHDQVLEAIDRLPGERTAGYYDLLWYRVPIARLEARTMQVLEKAGNTPGTPACLYAIRAPPSGQKGLIAGRLDEVLQDALRAIPSEASAPSHQVLMMLWQAATVGVPQDDLSGRMSIARALINAVRLYLTSDQHPRVLFWLQGKLAMEVARVIGDALEGQPENRTAMALALGAAPAEARVSPDLMLKRIRLLNFNAAVVAFENAVATPPLAPLVEPVTDVGVLGLLGDARYVMNQPMQADQAYARALDRFVDDGEPIEQVPTVASILTRWAGSRIGEGACQKDALPDPAWDARWATLGDLPYDICRTDGSRAAAQPVGLPTVRQLLSGALAACLPPSPDETHRLLATTDFRERFHQLDCLNEHVMHDVSVELQLTAEKLDDEIVRALSGKQ